MSGQGVARVRSRPGHARETGLARAEHEARAEFPSMSGLEWAKGTRCLIVDDVAAQRLILSTIVSSLGVDVDVASDGGQAVLMVTQKRYDLIFMDVSMPSMDGWTATRLIRDHEEDRGHAPTPIYIVSSHDSCLEILSSDDSGADGHISKPVMVKNIVRAVFSALKASA